MSFEEIVKDIKAGRFKSIYFLNGEEPFFIDRITDLIENEVLPEEEKAFNQSVLYGNDISMTTVTDTARRFPMMSPYQVVVVK
ncbi:MAG: DNA polymerase III subunit delta, partial [Odoribacter sp.]|nr:DNA polymerase III subunit delta [Odoribacter sp.]